MASNESIGSRMTRLKKIIEGSNQEASPVLNRETFLDSFFFIYNRCMADNEKKNETHSFEFTKNYRDLYNELKKLRVNIKDFTLKNVIGNGYFGEVHLAIENATKDVYALKKMPKSAFVHSKEERNIMVVSNSVWIPSLQYAFQDEKHLYLAMEYLPGGNLLNLMHRRGSFSEETARFYLAEITVALHALHSLGFVHRDIKPENILIDCWGHLKLADFGSAAKLDRDGHVVGFSPVGTPDYIAPELLQSVSSEKPMRTVYSETCDFWSLGIIAFEMITEITPFQSDNVNETYTKILTHDGKQKLPYPKEATISSNLRDLIDHLVTKARNRFNFDRIISHAFFRGIDWSDLRQQIPPDIPKLNGNDDTSNFDVERKEIRRNKTYDKSIGLMNGSNQDLQFIGFSYVNEETFADASSDLSETVKVAEKTEVRRLSMQVKNLQKTIDTQVTDINSLQKNLTTYRRRSAQMDSAEKILSNTKGELDDLKEKLKEKTVEVVTCRTQIKKLENLLKGEEETKKNFLAALDSTHQKWERSRKKSDENYERTIFEKNKEIIELKQKIKLLESDLESKADECSQLQQTTKNFQERLRSTKNHTDGEKSKFEQEIEQLTAEHKKQIGDLKRTIHKQQEEKDTIESELRRMKRQLQEQTESERVINDHKEKINAEKLKLSEKLQRKTDENNSLKTEKQSLELQIKELQEKVDELNRSVLMATSTSTVRSRPTSLEGVQSVYCSLESIPYAAEEQLRLDLVTAKEGENEQRQRADRLEQLLKKMEAAIENLSSQSVGEFLERKNEKLEDRLNAVCEQATTDRQRWREVNVAKWRIEKELDAVKNDKQKLEDKLKRVQNERDSFERRINESCVTLRSREQKITELEEEIRTLKAELTVNRRRLTSTEDERNASKAELLLLNTKLDKMKIDLDEAMVKLHLTEKQKATVCAENKEIEVKLKMESSRIHELIAKKQEAESRLSTMKKDSEKLKQVCAIMETQLDELETMYNKEMQQNKTNSDKLTKLRETLSERDARIRKLELLLDDEKSEILSIESRTCDLDAQLEQTRKQLADCQHKCNETHKQLFDKIEALMKAEEQIEVQCEEIKTLQHIRQSKEHELVVLKEENSKILTEMYNGKDVCSRLKSELENLKEDYAEDKQVLEREIDQLNETISEMKKQQIQIEVKFKETQSQYKKLVDHMQANKEKKKKTFVEVLFGHNSQSNRENVAPSDDIKRHKSFSHTTKVSKSNIDAPTNAVKIDRDGKREAMEVFDKNEKFQSSITTLQRKFLQEKTENEQTVDDVQMHHFEMTLRELSEPIQTCVVCNVTFDLDKPFLQCRKCKTSVHRKCRGDVDKNCSECDERLYPDITPISHKEYAGVLLREDMASPAIKILCLREIAHDVILLGCDSALKSYNVQTEALIHVANVEGVTCIAIKSTFPKCLLLADNGLKLLQCETRHLETRAQASVCLNSGLDYTELDSPYVKVSEHNKWRFVVIDDRSNQNIDNPIAIAGTVSQVLILQYDVNTKIFTAIRSLATSATAVLFTAHTAILSSDRYIEIDLQRLTAEEFLDMSDQTLSRAGHAKPMEAFALNKCEYLLCFEQFGIFVDDYGNRTRPKNVKWLRKPNGFGYRAPMLFVSYDDGVQVIRLSKSEYDDSSDEEHRSGDHVETFISTESPRILGYAGNYGIFVLSKYNSNVKQLARIDGIKALKSTLAISMETILSNESDL